MNNPIDAPVPPDAPDMAAGPAPAIGIGPLPPPVAGGVIQVYRPGHPLAIDLRSRVMAYLQQGQTSVSISKRLRISTSTITRYKKAAREQRLPVPVVRPRGGYRKEVALMNREQILALGNLLMKFPKLTIRELTQLAVQKGILNSDKVPCNSAVWRAIKKLDIDWKTASYTDPKGMVIRASDPDQDAMLYARDEEEQKGPQGEAAAAAAAAPAAAPVAAHPLAVANLGADLIAEERIAFRFVQKQGTDGQLNPYNLLFMDESNLR
jgi:transposase